MFSCEKGLSLSCYTPNGCLASSKLPVSVCCNAEATHSMQKTFQNVPLQTIFLIITKRYLEIMVASLVFDELTFSRKESLSDL